MTYGCKHASEKGWERYKYADDTIIPKLDEEATKLSQTQDSKI